MAAFWDHQHTKSTIRCLLHANYLEGVPEESNSFDLKNSSYSVYAPEPTPYS